MAVEVGFSVSSGSQLGTQRGLPVQAGQADGGTTIWTARNSSSEWLRYPNAIARDCKDSALDAFDQQFFYLDPTSRRLTVSSLDTTRQKCLFEKPRRANQTHSVVGTQWCAGQPSQWLAENVTEVSSGITTYYRVTSKNSTVCLTNQGLPEYTEWPDMHLIVAMPCSQLKNDTTQLFALGVNGDNLISALEPDKCLTAIQEVPLIQVATALQVTLGESGQVVQPMSTPHTSTGIDGSVTTNITVALQAGATYTIAVAVISSNDLGEHESSVVDTAVQALAEKRSNLTSVWRQHLMWWDDFWSRSQVSLGAGRQLLEGFWYGMIYMSGCMNREGKQATGLWGPWIQADNMNWNGDYTLDYNFQAQHYGAFSSNHPELARSYYDVILKAVDIGKRRAAYPDWSQSGHSGPPGMIKSSWSVSKPGMGNYSGAELPSHVSAYGGYYFGDLGTRGILGWVALVFVEDFDYTNNLLFMKETTYPLLLHAADFFVSYLVFNASSGRYDLNAACALEGCTVPRNPKAHGLPQRNVAMTLGWIRATFSALLRFSTILSVDRGRRPTWQHIVDHLAQFPTTHSQGQMVLDECEDSGDFPGNARYPVVYFGAIHPAAQITQLSSSSELLKAAQNTVDQVNAANKWVPENGLCMGWPAAAMVTHNASGTLDHMASGLAKVINPNFVPQILGGCVAEQAGATQALNDLLMQSYDGVLHFFPAGWDAGANASFDGLRGRGAFVVSAQWAHGAVSSGIAIHSEAGLNCTFVEPFELGARLDVEDSAGREVYLSRLPNLTPQGKAMYSFRTERGGNYSISRQVHNCN